MMVKAGAAVGNKFVGIHRFIILQKVHKVKGPQPLLVRLRRLINTQVRLLNWPHWAYPKYWLGTLILVGSM